MMLFTGLAVGGVLGIWLTSVMFKLRATAIVKHWIESGEKFPELELDITYLDKPSPNGVVVILRVFEQMAKANAEVVNTLIRCEVGPEHIDQWHNAGRPNLYGRAFTGAKDQPRIKPILMIDRVRLQRAAEHLKVAYEQALKLAEKNEPIAEPTDIQP